MNYWARVQLCLIALVRCACADPVHTIQAIDEKGYYLTLDDGSTWRVDWWNAWSSWHWKQGEHIQILEDGQLLLNLDQPESRARIFSTACPTLEQAQHRHFIAEISGNGRIIKLENGFTWEVLWEHETILESVRSWSPGDEVGLGIWHIFSTSPQFISYRLENLSRHTWVPVLFHESQSLVQYLHVQEANWTSITLDDGSIWEYDGWKLLPWQPFGWKLGDPVMLFVTDRSDPSGYLLINCSASRYKGHYVHVR